jgi:glucose/arabinose dehydrogenase
MQRGRTRLTLTLLEDRLTPTTLPPGFTETTVAAGLNGPTSLAVAPDGRLFVTEQGGALRVVKNATVLPTPFLSLSVDSSGERGLLGVAFDPNFAADQFVYVYYTVPGSPAHNRISRFTAAGDVAVPGSETVLMDLDPLSAATNHNGGALHFGPDGKLYVGVGENANGANSQTLANRLGKMLRINPDGSIPADNPFVGVATGANQAIWALGLRNPFTFGFQPGTGRLFIDDVGQSTWEEIDQGVAGANYGWPLTEGPTTDPRFRTPVFAYQHTVGDPQGIAITGGTFYDPPVNNFPAAYVGSYFFADLGGNWVYRLDPTTGAVTPFALHLTVGTPVDLDVDAGGGLLVLQRGGGANTGTVTRIAFSAPTGQGPVVVAGSGAGGAPLISVIDAATGTVRTQFLAFEAGFTGGVRVAVGDLTGDGVPDIVAAAGPTGGPAVEVFDGATGAVVRSFFAYDPAFTGGVSVALGDVDGDHVPDIVTGAGPSGGPHVRVFSGATGALLREFFAYDAAFTGGVSVAAGDVNGDGLADIVTGAGPSGGPHVKVFSGADGTLLTNFFAYDGSFRGGVSVAVAGGEVVTGAGPCGGPDVRLFDGRTGTEQTGFFAYSSAFTGGVTVAAVDLDGDGRPEIVTGAGPSGGPDVRVWDGKTLALHEALFAFDPTFLGGVFVGAGGNG